MSRIYNYNVDDRVFFDTLMEIIKYGKSESDKNLLEILAHGKCNVIPNPPSLPYKNSLLTSSILNNFAEKQETYNRYKEGSIIIDATAYFSIIDLSPNIKIEDQKKLIDLCNKIINPDSGLKITKVEFKPLLIEKTSKSLDINEIINEISKNNLNVILPPDIPEKGKEMAKTYLYLYIVENSLRIFIHNVSKERYGENYSEEIFTTKMKRTIKSRKEKEDLNNWMPLRGDSELFYLDFADLGKIIQNNDIFENYFDGVGWIKSKIDDLTKCRNLVMHAGYIDKDTADLIEITYRNILKQLNGKI